MKYDYIKDYDGGSLFCLFENLFIIYMKRFSFGGAILGLVLGILVVSGMGVAGGGIAFNAAYLFAPLGFIVFGIIGGWFKDK